MTSPTKNFPISYLIETTRLAESLEGLNNSLAQSAGEKFCKKSGACGS